MLHRYIVTFCLFHSVTEANAKVSILPGQSVVLDASRGSSNPTQGRWDPIDHYCCHSSLLHVLGWHCCLHPVYVQIDLSKSLRLFYTLPCTGSAYANDLLQYFWHLGQALSTSSLNEILKVFSVPICLRPEVNHSTCAWSSFISPPSLLPAQVCSVYQPVPQSSLPSCSKSSNSTATRLRRCPRT